MRDFIRARTRKRDTHSGYSGCRCPTRKQKVLTESFCSVSGGFVAGKSGEPVVRAVSAHLNEDMDCVRSLYPGLDGMRRGVGMGVIADNFIQMGCYLAR